MAYEVLARKYRSRTFDEIVGQTAIATTLKNAVATGRIHHGYLFTGTRGVGKTSMARILAKALNCSSSAEPTPTPCCRCESCTLIAEGGDLDVVEIDAASNTGVDDMRELRSNAAFRPARSRFKVFIIDEVHMLSTSAFNALLKTLEEPPGHVKFVMATTEAHKVPATIQSRCQRFDFRSIDPASIAEQLQRILAAESIPADQVVVRRVARLANGSMRDALSLLDQLLAGHADRLTADLLEELLPTAHDEIVFQLVDAVAEGEAGDALRAVDRALSAGSTPERLCDVLVEHLRTLMLLRVCGGNTDLVDLGGAARDQAVVQSDRFDGPTYVYMIGLMEEVRRMTKSSGSPRPLIDAAVVRLALAKSFSSVADLLARLDAAGPAAPTSSPSRTGPAAGPGRATTAVGPQVGRAAAAPASAAVAGSAPRPKAQSRVNSAERDKVVGNPLVKRALELSSGTLVDIRAAASEPERSSADEKGESRDADRDSGGMLFEAEEPD